MIIIIKVFILLLVHFPVLVVLGLFLLKILFLNLISIRIKSAFPSGRFCFIISLFRRLLVLVLVKLSVPLRFRQSIVVSIAVIGVLKLPLLILRTFRLLIRLSVLLGQLIIFLCLRVKLLSVLMLVIKMIN